MKDNKNYIHRYEAWERHSIITISTIYLLDLMVVANNLLVSNVLVPEYIPHKSAWALIIRPSFFPVI